MNISNSKKELARIISENGGWRDNANWAAMDKNGIGMYSGGRPYWDLSYKEWAANADDGCCTFVINGCNVVSNYHQTAISREEYFHLHPAPDAKPEFCESVNRSIPELESKPTIEQLAADYRNRKDYADRKQDEADSAKADAEAKLAELVAAGKAIGLVVGVATSELVITEWRDLQCGDEIEILGDGWCLDNIGKIGVVREVEGDGYTGDLAILCDIGDIDEKRSDWGLGFKFIRRP